MNEHNAGSSPNQQPTTEPTSRRMLRVAAALLIFSFLLFLFQLVNLNIFNAKASGMDSLPVSIRAGSQADYSGDPHDFAVPVISENILNQIIRDIPATGEPRDRMATLQVALSSPVPTMTPDYRFAVTVTPTLPAPTATHIDTASKTPMITATRYNSPTPTTTHVYSSNNSSLTTLTNTPRPATRTSTPSRTATVTHTATSTASTTLTNTSTSTLTPTFTPSSATNTLTPTDTPTDAPTLTPTHTLTATLTPTDTPTLTFTPSATTTQTPTDTPTLTHTPTVAPSPTASPTFTPTDTPTDTPTLTATHTPTLTATLTLTSTPTNTLTLTSTSTDTPTLTPTNTSTATHTLTPTQTSTLTDTPSPTGTISQTPTLTPTATLTFTPTATSAPTSTLTPGSPACYPGTPNGLLPSDDTYIDGGSPLSNYGNSNTFEVRPDNGADRRGLVKFDLSSIPANANVTSATLYLYSQDNKTGQLTSLYRITSNWNENTVTWSTWGLLGGDFDSGTSYFTFIPDQNNCMLTMDISNLVQAWVNGTYPNYGLMLYSTGPNHIIKYSSKEDTTASRQPKLDIVYSLPTQTPTITASPTWTWTPSRTPTVMFTATLTPTYTTTPSPTYTASSTPTP